MARWAPLGDYLRSLDADQIRLSYEQVAEIIGGPLPASASDHRPVFWSNGKGNGYSKHWRRAGFRASTRGVPVGHVVFHRSGRPEPELSPQQPHSTSNADLILVGCVKTKRAEAAPAKDLYTSTLFGGRRAYAEASGKPWFVLSSEYGLVDPDAVIEPYDRYLPDQPADYRRRWGEQVARQLRSHVGELQGLTIEIHAGDEYVTAIRQHLLRSGATMVRPLEGMRLGEQLAWYGGEAHPLGEVPPTPTVKPAPDQPPPPQGDPEPRGVAAEIATAFMAGNLDLSKRPSPPEPAWAGMPEVRAIDALRRLGADAVAIRFVMTFIAAMDRARDADRLWDRSVDLYRSAAWTYQPSEVISCRMTELADELRAAGITQRHLPDASAWRIIAESLADAGHSPAIHRVIHDGRGHAAELLDEVVASSPAGTHRFPLLRGVKIRPMWVRLLAYPGGAEIEGLGQLPVAVDVQVRKVTEYLGVTNTAGLQLDGARLRIEAAWHAEVLHSGAPGPDGIENTCAALDPSLWFYGKWGCTFCERARRQIPISDICRGCRFSASTSTPSTGGA